MSHLTSWVKEVQLIRRCTRWTTMMWR